MHKNCSSNFYKLNLKQKTLKKLKKLKLYLSKIARVWKKVKKEDG